MQIIFFDIFQGVKLRNRSQEQKKFSKENLLMYSKLAFFNLLIPS